MKIISRVSVFPVMPQRITRLYELAFNLWWSWNYTAQELYRTLDPDLWDELNHNTVRFLSNVEPAKLEKAATDEEFLKKYDSVLVAFDAYMNPKSTWYKDTYPQYKDNVIAYFSAEFGLHEALPIYSGGLGVLAGDHCKAASDIGLPLVGVGFLYPQGYFIQRINYDGRQEAFYEKIHFSEVPATAAVNQKGEEVVISVDLPGRKVYAKVWKIQVGRIPLYLMDTDVDPNLPGDRDLTARLYSGDHELRIMQEIVLGIGGVRALRALGIAATVYHSNDSHPVFQGLERVRELVQGQGLSFDQAKEAAAASGVFTTHTPVAAGNDVFNHDLIDRYFGSFWPYLGIDRDGFMNLARHDQPWGAGYSMTVLALHLSNQHNGVSALHGSVSRNMWQWLWPGVDADEVPIDHVTNGIHTQTWLAPELDELYTQYLGADWKERIDDSALWQAIDTIPDQTLWDIHCRAKKTLIEFLRKRVIQMRVEVGEGTGSVEDAGHLFDENAFTIGFARRFATYKRATLIFRDVARIQKLLGDKKRPVQIVFAGKAHPADDPGKSFIQRVHQISRQEGFEGRIVFLENYDMNMGRYLVQGVDMWLNNPIRPNEASGTSGQKAALNGVPNASILDGWWPEAYNGKNGWAIGEERTYQSQDIQDEADSLALYSLLENDIVPTYFNRDEKGLPLGWIKVMKESIKTVAPYFSTRRMLKDYTNKFYISSIKQTLMLSTENYTGAKAISSWKRAIYDGWNRVAISAKTPVESKLALGQEFKVTAQTYLGQLKPSDVVVEFLMARDEDGKLVNQEIITMELANGPDQNSLYNYAANVKVSQGGSIVMGVRVLPTHPALTSKHELGLVRWA
ncbi:alpha-glucan family phosphorylase [Candidatus Chlorohelix sp.]|uniref:alpha-glucan family phosphorylase n=1 Tax=Candidatus Chlorohelix sp. TaxID=3139201 RepID=UPI0030204666